MTLRLLHILFLNVVLFSIASLANAAEQSRFFGNEAEISFKTGTVAASQLEKSLEADISAPENKHSTPCYLECQPPFLRSLNQARPMLPGKADVITHSSGVTPFLAITSRSGWLNGQIPIILFNPPGPPYQTHRARTGRQLA